MDNHKLDDFRTALKSFYKTNYFRPAAVHFCLSFLPSLLMCRLCRDVTAGNASVALTVFLTILPFLCPVLFWIYYYHNTLLPALKIEELKEKYKLVDTGKSGNYNSSLREILDLIDHSLDREYSSRLLQKQAEYDAMKNQINPHFLYNTLDTIRGYAMTENAPITANMIEALSRIFRYSISQKNPLTTLRQEIGIIHDYIRIQEYRSNQHITFVEETGPDPNVLDTRLPKLILQPFIENAIKYGMPGIQRDFIIRLKIARTQARLIISIEDNGAGMTTSQLRNLNTLFSMGTSEQKTDGPSPENPEKGTGIALSNINARIRLMYGDLYGVTAYSTLGKGSEFQIAFPLQ